MDTTWLAPSAVLGIGAAAAAVLLRRIVAALEEARGAQRRLRRLEDGLIPVRVETRRTRQSVDRLRHR